MLRSIIRRWARMRAVPGADLNLSLTIKGRASQTKSWFHRLWRGWRIRDDAIITSARRNLLLKYRVQTTREEASCRQAWWRWLGQCCSNTAPDSFAFGFHFTSVGVESYACHVKNIIKNHYNQNQYRGALAIKRLHQIMHNFKSIKEDKRISNVYLKFSHLSIS